MNGAAKAAPEAAPPSPASSPTNPATAAVSALEKENADLRERLAAAERELARYRAREDWPSDPYGAGENEA